MKAPFYRFIAILLLVIPGLTATYGFLAMKDAFFAQFDTTTDSGMLWGKFFLGLVLISDRCCLYWRMDLFQGS